MIARWPLNVVWKLKLDEVRSFDLDSELDRHADDGLDANAYATSAISAAGSVECISSLESLWTAVMLLEMEMLHTEDCDIRIR
jgi:hypothetical protein